jgi:hypothetical protein
LQDLVRSFLESQRDQLLQRSLDPDEVDRVGSDPYLELALYRRIHDAFDQAVARRLQLSGVGLTTTQIEAYFNGWFDAQRPSEQS